MNANDAPNGSAVQSSTTTQNARENTSATKSPRSHWVLWWRMESAQARLRREVDELLVRTDKLEARVDAMQITLQTDLAMAEAALDKMRHDFDYALSQNQRRSDMYRIGWWHDLAPGGRSRPTVEYFGAGQFQNLTKRVADLRSSGNHVIVEIVGIGAWKRVSL